MRSILVTISMLLAGSVTYAAPEVVLNSIVNENAGLFDIQKVVIERVSTEEVYDLNSTLLDYTNDCDKEALGHLPYSGPATPPVVNPPLVSPLPQQPSTTLPPVVSELPTDGLTEGDVIGLDQIINLGQKLWQFITDNKPVVSAKTITANALPRGVKCWGELENWSRPRSEVFRASYLNGFGIEVVNLEFRLLYTPGGQVNGLGRYLSNVTVQYRKLDVMWGFKISADVEVPLVVNVASKADPVAGMQISLHWVVNGLNHVERTASFFVYGDGRPADVLD